VWEKILKIEIRNFSDARRVGEEYALEDIYEASVLSEEEYQRLSNREKQSLHSKLENLLKKFGKNSWAEERKKFHAKMRGRAQRGNLSTTMIPDDNYNPRKRERRGRKKRIKTIERRKKPNFRSLTYNPRNEKQVEELLGRAKTQSQMILDYFKMWRNMYNRLPTLTEITNSEGRPLTVDEERTYNEEYARRTQE